MGDRITNFDELLVNSMGHCGVYQTIIIALIFLHRAPVGFHLLAVAVFGAKTDYNCTDAQYDRCDADCPGHEFDHSVWKSTIVTEWDLVCGRKTYFSIIQTLVMFGILVGAFIFGWAGDKFGRLYPLCVAVTLQLITGVAAAFVSDIYSYTFFRFMASVATGGSMVPSFALFMEFTAKKYRTTIGVLYTIPVHVAHALLGPLSYWCRAWDCIQMWMSLYSVCLLTYWCLLPESPRWLFNRNKTDKMVKVLETAAKFNKMPTDHIKRQGEQFANDNPQVNVKAGRLLDLLSTRKMRVKTIVMCWNWTVISMQFYAVAQYIGMIGGNIFINVTAAGLIQIPGNLLGCLMISVVGRKWALITSYMISAFPMIAVMFTLGKAQLATTTLCCISMAGAAMSFGLIYVYTGEIFPTVIRSTGVGMCSMWARVGSMISPFIMHLDDVASWMPPMIFVLMPTLAALATLFFLPETKGQPLADTVAEADEL